MKLMFLPVALALTLSSELVSTYEVGEVRRTSIHLESVRTLVESEISIDGEPNPETLVRLNERKRTLEATFLDTVQRVKGKGRPVSLLRQYSDVVETVSRKTEGAWGRPETAESVYSSELEGKHVLFKGSIGRLKGSFPRGTRGDRKLLKVLEPELPWRFLLPQGRVEEGSTWDVDVEVIWRLLRPGGDLALTYDRSGTLEDRRKAFAKIRRVTKLDGKVTATLRKLDGGKAKIGLAVAFTEAADTTAAALALNKALGLKREKNVSVSELLSSGFKHGYKGKGLLTWDIGGERPESLELELETSALEVTTTRSQSDEKAQDMQLRYRYEGTLKLSIEQQRQVQ